jgi:hypothetical protein
MSNTPGVLPPEGRPLEFGSIATQLGFLEGKVLTVIDAALSDQRQLKAVKDLVKKMFSEQRTWISQLCYVDEHMVAREQLIESGMDLDAIERSAPRA